MKVINILFSGGRGGREQAFVDYTEALIGQGGDVSVVVLDDMDALYVTALKKLKVKIHKVKNRFGYLDYPLVFKIRGIIKKEKPNVVLVHSGRAISIVKRGCKGLCSIIGVNHSSNVKRSLKCDGVFVVNSALKKKVISLNKNLKNKTFIIPSMIKIPKKIPEKKKEGKVLVIGTMARLDKTKGIAELIEAVNILKGRGVRVSLVVAGDGDEMSNLRCLVKKYGLEKQVKFLGWVKNLKKFFDKIDIFCLPSYNESFGIVFLYAMLYGKAIVATDCDGPRDIFKNNKDAVIVSRKNLKNLPEKLSEGLLKVIRNKKLRNKISRLSHKKVLKKYSMKGVGKEVYAGVFCK